jgi:hypothetical protein
MWMGPGPPSLSYIHIRPFLTRLFFNPHTVHSDVGGTISTLCRRARKEGERVRYSTKESMIKEVVEVLDLFQILQMNLVKFAFCKTGP